MKIITLGNENESMPNFTADYIRHVVHGRRPEALIWCLNLVYSAITVFGTLGNLLIIVIICITPSLRNLPNVLVCNLAVADLMMAVTLIPFVYIPSIELSFPYNEFMCMFTNAFSGSSIYCSSVTIILVSCERLRSIKAGVRSCSKKKVAAFVAVTWSSALILALPSYVFRELQVVKMFGINETLFNLCQLTIKDEVSTWLFHSNTLFFIYVFPLAAILVTNNRIQAILLASARLHRSLVSGNTRRRRSTPPEEKNQKIFDLLIAMAICYGLLRLPWSIVYVLLELGCEKELMNLINLVATCVNGMNVCVNPVMFTYLNKNFQRTVLRHLRIIRRRTSVSWQRYTFSGRITNRTTVRAGVSGTVVGNTAAEVHASDEHL